MTQYLTDIQQEFAAVTAPQEFLQALEESERRFRLFMDNMPGCAFIKDEAGRRVYVSKRWCEAVGRTAEEALGKDASDLFSPEVAAMMRETDQRVLESDAPVQAIERIPGIDGKVRDWLVHKFPFREQSGRRLIAGMAIDITEVRQAKAAAEKAQAVAEATSKAKSEFLANMSHEIRTPMTTILGHIDLLEDAGFASGEEGLSPQECQQSLHAIRRNSEHLLQLINDILDLSKIEAGKLPVERTECSPAQVISDVAAVMRVRAMEKKVAFRVQYIGPVPQTVRTDPMRLRQVLINLVSNALKFTSAGSVRLLVRLLNHNSFDSPQLQFQVVDTGIGMTQEQVSMLFQPFSQTDNSTTRRSDGSGLGLLISRRLAEAMGGGVMVDSISGAGTTCTVWIDPGDLSGVPLLMNPADVDAAFVGSVPLHDRLIAPGSLAGRRVLLAEDGIDNQYLISLLLRRAGARATAVDNGRAALQRALDAVRENQPFDVVLMDMQMPEMDGYTATQRLRDRGYTGKIIALTAHTMPGDRERCLASGCDDYIAKPFEPRCLMAAIQHVLSVLDDAAASEADRGMAATSGRLSARQGRERPDHWGALEEVGRQLRQALETADVAALGEHASALKRVAGGWNVPAVACAAHVVDRAVQAGLSLEQVQRAVEELIALCEETSPAEWALQQERVSV